MKNILIAILTSVLLFAASAGTSLYLNQPEADPEAGTEDVEKLELPPKEPFPEDPVKEMANQMPVGTRPDQARTIEAVQQMSESVQKRQKQLDEFENELKGEEKNIERLMQDLKRENMQLNAFSDGVEAKIVALDNKIVQLTDLLGKVEKEKKELQTLQRQTGVDSASSNDVSERVAEIKDWFKTMAAETASKVIIAQANSGDLEMAAELLHSQEDRQKTKILEAIEDPVLINQLIQALKVKKTTRKK